MIPSFHAVFGLRQRDASAKVIDYNDQVIRVREYLFFLRIPSPMYFQLNPLPQTFATFASNVCILCLKRLQVLATVPAKHCLFPLKRLSLLAQEIPLTWFRSSHTHVPICPPLCSYDNKISLLCIRIFLWPWSFLPDAPFLPIIYNARFVKKM